jgi:lyso-ornithine lipid O-acyltransferase
MKRLKIWAFALGILHYVIITIPMYPLFKLAPMRMRRYLIWVVSVHCRYMRWLLNAKVKIVNEHHLKREGNHLIVSNHLSYLDILILAGEVPTCFVTSLEMKETPFLGQICSLAGCLFVDRKNKRNIHQEIKELKEALESGLDVTIFPEATSTKGDEVLRFRRPLFEASIASGKPILPLTLNYLSVSGQPITAKNRDVVCWYDDMGFFDHFLELIKQSEVSVEIVVGEPIIPVVYQSMELAIVSHQVVSSSFKSLNIT